MSIAKEFANSIKDATKEKTSSYDTQATVTRIEGTTAWVHIPGGVSETPVQLTVNASEGDIVQVRVANGKAWITGNASAPPTDDKRANVAYNRATSAQEEAQLAHTAAEDAIGYAEKARQAADDAQTSADDAQASANNASEYASRALGNLSTVQNVTETLNWITQHGTMTLTTDTALDPSHVYFVLNDPPTGQTEPHGDYYVGGHYYDVVSEPSLADISNYYELSINESLNNYVATHLVVDSEGLWIIPDAGGNKVLIATGQGTGYPSAGTYIVGASAVLASFTANGAQIGQNASGLSRAVISADGMQIYRNVNGADTQIVNLGYGEGQAESGIAVAPYFTLGTRVETAEPYDSSKTYQVGDLAIRNGELMICISVTLATSTWVYYRGSHSFASGIDDVSAGYCSFAEGYGTKAIGWYSHTEGRETIALGDYSHAEGYGTKAIGADHVAGGGGAHAEGIGTIANAYGAHAEGRGTSASNGGHAEGTGTKVSNGGHAEGKNTSAGSAGTHAEGIGTEAMGAGSHAGGWHTIANKAYETVIGRFNVEESGNHEIEGNYAFIIGNGTPAGDNGTLEDIRSNALAVTWDGDVELSINNYTTSGDVDKDIYDALTALGWDTDCIITK